jgi:ABC-2 type transport system ATP-binding protein
MTWGVTHLTVRFGDTIALDDVSLRAEPGAITAVVGGDGAGKSTLLRALAGIALDHDGRIDIPPPGRIGYVPPDGGVFRDLTVDENMEFIAGAFGLSDWRDRAAVLLGKSDIARFGDRLGGNLSGGQRRKLAGSMAMLPQPDLLVLDEVTTGVDPVSRMDLWRLVTAAAAGGTAVVLATSYLDEAERAVTALLLHRGRAIAAGTPADIIRATPGSIEETATPSDRARAWRHGRTWRQWHPDGDGAEKVTMEDAAIVAEIRSEDPR